MTLKERVRYNAVYILMMKKALSIKDIATRLEISPQAAWQMMRGRRSKEKAYNIGEDGQDKLCQVFGIEIDDLGAPVPPGLKKDIDDFLKELPRSKPPRKKNGSVKLSG